MHNLKRNDQGGGSYTCAQCGKIFKNKYKLERHHKVHKGVKDEICLHCQKAFTRRDHLKVHVWNKHGLQMKKVQKSYTYSFE